MDTQTGKKKRGGKKKVGNAGRTKKSRKTIKGELPNGFVLSNPEALQVLVQSGYMKHKDLGRFLLLTSKGLTDAFVGSFGVSGVDSDGQKAREGAENAIWKPILLSRVRNTKDTASLTEGTGLSAKACFHKFVLKIEEEETVPRPLQYSPEDYVVIVTMKSRGNISIYKTIRGQDIPEFFVTGKGSITFDKPVWRQLAHYANYNIQYDVSIMRVADNTCILCLGNAESEYIVEAYGDGDICEEEVSSYSPSPSPVSASYGKALMRTFFRHQDSLRVGLGLQYQILTSGSEDNTSEDDRVEIVGVTLTGVFDASGDHFDEWMELDAHKVDAIKHGTVTFGHFLEALDGWN